jgi:hypothetical protein
MSQSVVKCDRIEAEEIVLKHPEGKAKLTGWCHQERRRHLGEPERRQRQGRHRHLRTMNRPGRRRYLRPWRRLNKGSRSLNIALSVDNNGNPFVQVVKPDGSVKELGYDEAGQARPNPSTGQRPMAKVNLEYDTKDKSLKTTMDGKPMDNVHRAHFYAQRAQQERQA